MSRLPQLEAQLVAAAGKRHPRVRRPLLLAGALAVAACVAVALLLAPSSAPQRHDRPVTLPETVPAATLVKAAKLAKMPAPQESKLRDDQMVPVARDEMAKVPFPPGVRDEFDYFAHRRTLLYSAVAVRGAVQYHAYCAWVRYWVNGADRAGATAVLVHVPYWPLMRQGKPRRPSWFYRMIARVARAGDEARMRQEATTNCTVRR
jgi:hypothetical protein